MDPKTSLSSSLLVRILIINVLSTLNLSLFVSLHDKNLFFPGHIRVRRGFRSYFYNYLDEIAMATCAAIPSNGPGLIYAVRR